MLASPAAMAAPLRGGGRRGAAILAPRGARQAARPRQALPRVATTLPYRLSGNRKIYFRGSFQFSIAII